jgi:hypothetical protein
VSTEDKKAKCKEQQKDISSTKGFFRLDWREKRIIKIQVHGEKKESKRIFET